MIICNGQSPAPLSRLEAGARCTIFAAALSPHTARKQWIAGALTPKGTNRIDDGAARALRAGRSLLPRTDCAARDRVTIAPIRAVASLILSNCCAISFPLFSLLFGLIFQPIFYLAGVLP
jgi:hypothetical protein